MGSVWPDGRYEVLAGDTHGRFRGDAHARLHDLVSKTGRDVLGEFRELDFAFDRPVERRASIRLYEKIPAALFLSRFEKAGANTDPFPTFSGLPSVPYHLSYYGVFFPYSFEKFSPGAPWILFDGERHTFVLSAASHFVIAQTQKNRAGEVECGIDPAIRELPAGYEQQTIVFAGTGIGSTMDAWGSALRAFSGKSRPANDEGPELARLGYWTDNGAAYYYKFLPGKTADATLLEVAARYREEGIPIGYFQLDSWWYRKAKDLGVLEYQPDGPPIFSASLDDFQARLGLPLVVHGRWISPESPIRQKWKVSGTVVVDPDWWNTLAGSLSASRVGVFEQDWLNVRAIPERNLSDPEAFLTNMSKAFASRSMRIQYCMAAPADILQSTLYPNVTNCRVSSDRFEKSKWAAFFHASLLARAVGLWPWADVFRSGEIENLLLALLSGGVVGIGDAIGEENPGLLHRAVRADGLLVKADTPIVPTDQTLIREAKGENPPLICATSSDFGAWKGVYVFAFSPGPDKDITLEPRDLGIGSQAFLLDVATGAGHWLKKGEAFRDRLTGYRDYFVLVPVGPSGVAFLGDEGKLVMLGKKRIASVSDDGSLHVRVIFAPGEETVRLHGFAAERPKIEVEAGRAGTLEYQSATGEFHLPVSPAGGEVRLSLRAK